MSSPLVSVCLPNLNTYPYLRERVDTILAQTYANWELVISDNHSEDGAWEFFQELARQDPRVSIAQAPREGLYRNWNQCVRRARGEYVYIATSDDGMGPDCLEKLVSACERHPDCDAAHCTLVVVDENGAPLTNQWWLDGLFARSLPDLVDRPHTRKAPYDGLLCLLGEQVYYSITELLFRRSLFSRIGDFESRWGSVSDFQWYMRVGLVANIVHVPDTWATWRVHPKQATDFAGLRTAEHEQKVDEMIDDALRVCAPLMDPAIVSGLRSRWLDRMRDMRKYYRGLVRRPSTVDRRAFQVSQFFEGSTVRSEVLGRLMGKPRWTDAAPEEIRDWLESVGLGPVASLDAGSLRSGTKLSTT
jgi:glycosyltransferase involved in cell wall biosynthesis